MLCNQPKKAPKLDSVSMKPSVLRQVSPPETFWHRGPTYFRRFHALELWISHKRNIQRPPPAPFPLTVFPWANFTVSPFHKWGPSVLLRPEEGNCDTEAAVRGVGGSWNPYPALTQVCTVSVCLRSQCHISPLCNENQLKAHAARLTFPSTDLGPPLHHHLVVQPPPEPTETLFARLCWI